MINEKKITNYPDYVNIESTDKILKQMRNCIGKLFIKNGKGTGFFSHIPYKNSKLPVLITCYHCLNEEYIKQNDTIKLGINDELYEINIKLDYNRKIFLDKEYDLTIIEIKEIDKVNDINFLELDKHLLLENPIERFKSDNSIYILQYPKGCKASVSYGIIEEFYGFKIQHLCCTESGSSGSPILNLKTNQVIGIHNGVFHEIINLGTFLKEPLDKIKNNYTMKTIHEIKIPNNNIHNNNFINNNNYNKHNKDDEILDMISNEEYEQNIQFFEKKEKEKKNKIITNNNILKHIINNNIFNNKPFQFFYKNINFYGNEKKIFERSINDGVYNIIPMHCFNRAIEITNGSKENMANLQLYEYNNSKSQQFEIKYNSENKYYTIKCLCSNKYLTVDYNNECNIVQTDENKLFNQRWYIVKKGDNYEIISYNSLLMDVNGKGQDLGTNISCFVRTGNLNQQFQFKSPYFPKTPYTGISIVDGLKEINAQSSLEYRKKIAKVNDIKDYEGIDFQNLFMLDLLKKGVLIKPIEN